MKAPDILTTAAKLVGGDRERSHGGKATNFASIAAVWNGYLLARGTNGKSYMLSGEDVANMMELMKIARRLSGSFNIDDYIDGAGYAACAGEIGAFDAVPHEKVPSFRDDMVP